MSLSYRVKQDLILAAHLKATGASRWSVGIAEMYDDSVVFEDYESGSKRRCTYAIDADSLEVTLGAPQTVIEVPTFQSLPASADAMFSGEVRFSNDGRVLRRGMLFRAGDYPDKGVSVTTADLQAAIENFSPAPLDIEHRETLFDGKLGSVERVWLSGSELWGEVAIPKWLDETLRGVKKRVSCTFALNPFRLVGLALTTTPRVADAALIEASQNTEVKKVADKTGFLAKLRELVTSPDAEIAFSEEKQSAPVPPPAPASVPPVTPNDEVARLRDEINRVNAQSELAAATAFADNLVREGRINPAHHPAVVAMFTAAAEDDRTRPRTVSFAIGEATTTGTRVDVVRALFSALPDQRILGEHIDVAKTAEFIKRAASQGGEKPSEEEFEAEVHKFMSQGSIGQSILEQRRSKNFEGGR